MKTTCILKGAILLVAIVTLTSCSDQDMKPTSKGELMLGEISRGEYLDNKIAVGDFHANDEIFYTTSKELGNTISISGGFQNGDRIVINSQNLQVDQDVALSFEFEGKIEKEPLN